MVFQAFHQTTSREALLTSSWLKYINHMHFPWTTTRMHTWSYMYVFGVCLIKSLSKWKLAMKKNSFTSSNTSMVHIRLRRGEKKTYNVYQNNFPVLFTVLKFKIIWKCEGRERIWPCFLGMGFLMGHSLVSFGNAIETAFWGKREKHT